MITVGEKKWTKLTDEEKISYCKDNLITPAKEERQTHDRKWYLSNQFLAGNHYIYFNATSNALESPPRRRNAVRLVINKIKSTIRSVLNYSTRFQPKFECIPGDLDKDTIKNARRSGKVLDFLFVKLYLRSKVRKLVRNALVTSVGFWELGWDDAAEGGLGQVTVVNHDPFDIFLPATAEFEGPKINSSFIAKVVTRNVADIKADERYDEEVRKEVKPDVEIAFSTMKARILRKHGQKSDRKEGQDTALVYEIMLWDPEGNEKGGNINLVTFANEDKLLRDEELENTEFPMYVMQADTSSSRLYDTSWVEDMIPINKGLDRQESQIMEYNNQMLRARIITEKGHGANLAATGRSGMDVEVIEVNPGRKFEQFRVYPLPQTIDAQIQRSNRYLEVIGGANEASIGVMPAGARSGKTLEALQAADANNLAGIREGLEDFLSVVGSRILDIVAEKYQTSRIVKLSEEEEGEQFMKVVGGEATQRPEGAAIVNKDNEIIVKIGSWLGYTREAQRETLMELGSTGFLPKEAVLKEFEFANIEELSSKARDERLEEAEMQADIAGRRGEGQQGQAPAGPAPGGGPDMLALADEENARMMNGEVLKPTPNAPPDHTQAHVDFLQSPDAQANQRGATIIEEHARGELKGVE